MGNKNNIIKFGFLIVVTLVILFVLYKQFIAPTSEKEAPTEEVEETPEVEAPSEEDNIDVDELKEKYDSEDEEIPEEEKEKTTEPKDSEIKEDSSEVESYKVFYSDKYSKELLDILVQKAQKTIEMLFEKEVAKKEWLKYLSKDVYKKNIPKTDGVSLNKFEGQKINDITISPVAPIKDNEIMFEAKIEWSYSSDDTQTSLVYFIYDPKNKKNIAKDLNIL